MSIGLLGGLIGLLPPTSGWEEGAGLGLLFKLRGQRPAPAGVTIVSINGQTAQQLELGEEIPEWPRSLHAQIIERLWDAGVAVIAFDIFFKKPRDSEQDGLLAESIDHAGNVLLVGYLERRQRITSTQSLQIERLIPPMESLRDAATGIAPFILPKVPVRVSRFWTVNGENALPSLPTAALWQLADPQGERLRQLCLRAGEEAPPPGTPRETLGQRLRSDPELTRRLRERLLMERSSHLSPQQHHRLLALLQLHAGDDYPYLNFYGPPATIHTIPYQTLLKAKAESLEELRDQVVFIGYAGHYQPKQRDGFYTVFTQDNGLDLSGVEIAATAFANLLHGETLKPLGPAALFALLLGYGLGITLLLQRLPGMVGVLGVAGVGILYLGLVYFLFAQRQLWLPWCTPLLLQTPAALIITLTRHYRQMRLSRERLRELFGYYLPGEVIDRLAEDKQRTMEQSDSAFGICLASDARQYTSLAERMEPSALQAFLNRYYEVLFAPVRSRGGIISDVVGDAMLAIWPANRPDPTLRQKACEAALEIIKTLAASNLQPRLPTRIGLHAGELVMSHVGAMDHFEYRAVGDMVNTASRIENLNKLLGTAILASEEMLIGLQDIVTRELGAFLVAGRQRPITLYEVAALERDATPSLHMLHAEFAEALAIWKRGERADAYARFQGILRQYPDDGPSAYYVEQFHERRASRINPLDNR